MLKPPNVTPGWRPAQAREGLKEVEVNGTAHLMNWYVQDDAEFAANCRFFGAAKQMADALATVLECGEPEKISLYDEDGVEGWIWRHSSGREWTDIGSWDKPAPMHPIIPEALLAAGYTEQPDEA